MKLSSPTSLLLNLGHAMDHWVIAIFLYTVSVIAGVWGTDWKELTPYAFGASFVFGAIPFTDAMIVRYVDDRMRSRVTGMRLAIGFGVSSVVVAAIGPSVKAAGFPTLLMTLAIVALCTVIAISFLPNERQNAMAALKPAE